MRRYREEAGLARAEIPKRAQVRYSRAGNAEPAYAAMIEGIAAERGFPLLEITALSARYDLFYSGFASRGLATACTACAVLPKRTGGGLILAQTWDWFPEARCLWVKVSGGTSRSSPSPRRGSRGGKLRRGRPGRQRARVRSRSLERGGDAVPRPNVAGPPRPRPHRGDDAVEEGRSLCSAHFLVGDAKCGQALSLERTPTGTVRVEPQDGLLVHENPFLRGEELGVREPLAEERRSTCLRQERLSARLVQAGAKGRISVEDVEGALRDHGGPPRLRVPAQEPPFPA